MAMSFAPLSLLIPININNPQVVTKFYLNFWNDLESLGFDISKNK
jgi:5-enolpyruvylshikimate-3-phosphate synthase